MNSLVFVFFLPRSATVLLGELWLDCDALSFRSAEADAKGRGTKELVGIGVAFATVPFAELAFATLGDAFAETSALEALAVLTVLCEPVVVGELRGVLPSIVVGYAVRGAATSNSGVTEGPTCGAVFLSEPFA